MQTHIIRHTLMHGDTKRRAYSASAYMHPPLQPGAGGRTKSWQDLITKNKAWQQKPIFSLFHSWVSRFFQFSLFDSSVLCPPLICCYAQGFSSYTQEHWNTHGLLRTNGASAAWCILLHFGCCSSFGSSSYDGETLQLLLATAVSCNAAVKHRSIFFFFLYFSLRSPSDPEPQLLPNPSRQEEDIWGRPSGQGNWLWGGQSLNDKQIKGLALWWIHTFLLNPGKDKYLSLKAFLKKSVLMFWFLYNYGYQMFWKTSIWNPLLLLCGLPQSVLSVLERVVILLLSVIHIYIYIIF